MQPAQSAQLLLELLLQDKYENGEHVDYYQLRDRLGAEGGAGAERDGSHPLSYG